MSVGGQCGLLDVALDPKFADNGIIYFSYAEPASGGESGNSTAVARAKLSGNALTDVRTIFRQQPKYSSSAHCGGRLVFARDGKLFVTLGDRFARKDDAQTLTTTTARWCASSPTARCRRTTRSSAAPARCPRSGAWATATCRARALHPATGELWTHEHGPQGGDEVNVTEAGRNYGWPLLTYGRNYGIGTRIGEEGPQARLRAAAEGVGAVDRAQRHGVSHQRPLPGLEGQPVRRRTCAARCWCASRSMAARSPARSACCPT